MTANTATDSGLYRFLQWALFPAALLGTPTAIYLLIESGVAILVAT